MKNINLILYIVIGLLQYANIVYSRVVYIMAHAEKPSEGSADTLNESTLYYSSMNGLGHSGDGLGYTGTLVASCMMKTFGPDAPIYRRPKRILSQQFVFQHNGDYIHSGIRGHHTSRRMYHQTYALALALGIDPDTERCCGGNYYDLMDYVNTLPPEDDPILIVNQHGVVNSFIHGYALSNNVQREYSFFGKTSNRVITMIDGNEVEDFYMCCNIPLAQCTDHMNGTPLWANTYKFLDQTVKQPIYREVTYPSYIYTPENVAQGTWSHPSNLRKRGLYSGEECVNGDLVDCPFLKNFTKSAIIGKSESDNINENKEETNGYDNKFYKKQIINIFMLIFSIIYILI